MLKETEVQETLAELCPDLDVQEEQFMLSFQPESSITLEGRLKLHGLLVIVQFADRSGLFALDEKLFAVTVSLLKIA